MQVKAVIVFLFVLCASCTYNNEQDLYPSNDCVIDSLSYSKHIVPLLSNNGCLSCHSSQASLVLEGYENVKIAVDNGSLIGSLKHSDGYRPMPDAQPKISECSIDQVEAWISDGALNN